MVLSDIEVLCSVCATRPQNKGPGATFVASTAPPDAHTFDGDSVFFDSTHLNALQEEWTMSVNHRCPSNSLNCQSGPPSFVLIPGLDVVTQPGNQDVAFIGCKGTSILLENEGAQYRQGSLIDIEINVPATAKAAAVMDVTSCEISYLRTCNAGEGYFKDICGHRP